MEGRSHLWVHLNGVVLLEQDLAVPLLDLCLDPLAKGVAQDGEGHVAQVVLRQAWDLDHVWEPRRNGRLVLHQVVADLLDAEALVMWDRDPLESVVLDRLLLAGNQVFQVVAGDRVVRRQDHLGVDLQELKKIKVDQFADNLPDRPRACYETLPTGSSR